MADVVVTDDIKRGIKQLRLIGDQLLGGVLDPVAIRQPLQDILEHKNPNDLCECRHIRAGHRADGRCSHSITERHEGMSGMRGSTTRPCPCLRFRLAQSANREADPTSGKDTWIDPDLGEVEHRSLHEKLWCLYSTTYIIVLTLLLVWLIHPRSSGGTLFGFFIIPSVVAGMVTLAYRVLASPKPVKWEDGHGYVADLSEEYLDQHGI